LTAYTQQEIDEAGNGAHEIRTWIVAAGAVRVGFDVLAYEAVPEWLTGTAIAAARL
jgi:protocatechuate 4,5-dioxygenase beta chain/2,3-dihydroxyphenylpropionate 1,2-dioxygenase